jgi:hypothetical protein
MQTRQKNFGWNELDFLDWEEFRQMGPPIVKLEIQRIERLLAGSEFDPAVSDGSRESVGRSAIKRVVGAPSPGDAQRRDPRRPRR